MDKTQKLELTWVGKDNQQKLEPGRPIEDTERFYHALHYVRGKDDFDNQPIFGNSLRT